MESYVPFDNDTQDTIDDANDAVRKVENGDISEDSEE